MICNINGLEISYSVFGEGKPLLVLHGWGSKKENWQKAAENLSARVIIPDLPGFGESQEPGFAWETGDYADFVKEFAQKQEVHIAISMQSFKLYFKISRKSRKTLFSCGRLF